MARGRPFNILAACFYLLAVVICMQASAAIFAGIGCFYLNVNFTQQIGACLPVGQLIKEQWDKIFEIILALLVAGNARLPPPPSPPDLGGAHPPEPRQPDLPPPGSRNEP